MRYVARRSRRTENWRRVTLLVLRWRWQHAKQTLGNITPTLAAAAQRTGSVETSIRTGRELVRELVMELVKG